ncbi:PHP domain-containing protein [Solemya velesiana gill symbiont]|nr:PHP domain-containing protein [Solemya velesiana gill symbiont]
MSLSIDLHSHSTASDGTLSPSELILRASEKGVDVLALTDHDTTEGIEEAKSAAIRAGICLIPGVEVSVTWNAQVVHLVGLGVDPGNPSLQQGLATLRAFRDWRAEEIGRRLEKSGIAGSYEGARGYSNGRLISRTHFARFLVEKSYAPDTRKVFKRYLTRGNPGHVPGQWAALEEAVSWIVSAGGQAVLAHPARYNLTRTKLRRLIREFRDVGGEGIEVVSGSHSRDENFTMARHTMDFELKGSCGSDYHGPENPWTELGRLEPMPDGIKPVWSDWVQLQQAASA